VEQFTAEASHRNLSTTRKLKVEQFTAEAIHRKQFTAKKSRAIYRRANSPQTIHRKAIRRKGNSPQRQFTAEAIQRKTIHRKNNSPQKIKSRQFIAAVGGLCRTKRFVV
jgi:hypothetical protein